MQKDRAAATHENVALANSRRHQWISKAHRHTRQLATVFWSQLGIYNLHCRRVQFLGRSTILSSLGLRLLGLPVELRLQFPWLRPKKSSGFSLPWYSLHSDHGLLEACIRNIEYLEYLRAHRVDCPFFRVVKIAHIISYPPVCALPPWSYLNHTSISASFTTLACQISSRRLCGRNGWACTQQTRPERQPGFRGFRLETIKKC